MSEQTGEAGPPPQRRRWPWVLAAAIIVGLLGAGAALLVWSNRRTLPEPPPLPSTTTTVVTPTELRVSARGTTGTEAVEVWVGVNLVHEFTASQAGGVETASFDHDGAVEVRFVNDGIEGDVDRDLIVESVEIDGEAFASASASTLATGFVDPDTGSCVSRPTAAEVDTLKCNGFFRYVELIDGELRALDLPAPE